jgi:hypothetical protein
MMGKWFHTALAQPSTTRRDKIMVSTTEWCPRQQEQNAQEPEIFGQDVKFWISVQGVPLDSNKKSQKSFVPKQVLLNWMQKRSAQR